MYNTCAACKYDLTGLDRDLPCPECGALISHRAIFDALSHRRTRLWRCFFLAPIFTVPGCIAYGIGQPVVCFLLCTILAHRALKLDDAIYEREPLHGAMLIQSFLFAVAWTISGTAILIALIAVISTIVGHRR